MRTIDNYLDIHEMGIYETMNWDGVTKSGKYSNIKRKLTPAWIHFNRSLLSHPIVWKKGECTLLVFQLEHFQEVNEDGQKTWGFCRTYYFRSDATPLGDLRKLAEQDVHPKTMGYELMPVDYIKSERF